MHLTWTSLAHYLEKACRLAQGSLNLNWSRSWTKAQSLVLFISILDTDIGWIKKVYKLRTLLLVKKFTNFVVIVFCFRTSLSFIYRDWIHSTLSNSFWGKKCTSRSTIDLEKFWFLLWIYCVIFDSFHVICTYVWDKKCICNNW